MKKVTLQSQASYEQMSRSFIDNLTNLIGGDFTNDQPSNSLLNHQASTPFVSGRILAFQDLSQPDSMSEKPGLVSSQVSADILSKIMSGSKAKGATASAHQESRYRTHIDQSFP
ncbi:hypothetical protein TNCV_2334701 [Trichonephila clavipes]|nr:hypothetical protein TNCV_2334701 [Trichonephila clavipes]